MSSTGELSRTLNYWAHQYEAVFGIFLAVLVFLWRENSQLVYPHILYLIVLLMGLNLAASLALKRWPAREWISAIIICANNATVTVLMAYSGGRESNLWVLYLLPISTACLLLGGREVAWITLGAISFNAVYFVVSTEDWDAATFFELFLKSGIFVFSAAMTHRVGQKEKRSRHALVDQATKLGQVEGDLADVRQRMDDILANVRAVLWEVRCGATPDFYQLRFVSPNVEAITGYPAHLWIEDPRLWLALMPPEDRERIEAELPEVLSGRSQGPRQFRWCLGDGAEKWMEAHIAVIRDPEGRPRSVRGIILDISERRKTEEALRRSEEQLRQAQKMGAIGRLAGGIAHDFNNLLTAILGSAHFLMESLPDEDSRRPDVVEIKTAGERAAALTQQLLAFSRRQALQPRVVDLNAIIKDMKRMLRRLVREDISLQLEPEERLWPVKVDPGQMEQVIMNLVVNARDAMPKGGSVRIATRHQVFGEPQTHPTFSVPMGAYVILSIADTGAGMDAQTLNRLFEPFFTTKEVGKGTGLGLSTVYGIVKQSGGYIAVSSEPGEGTVFNIFLPRTEGPVEVLSRDRQKPSKAKGAETILLAEDEEQVRNLAHRILVQNGYTVLLASDGAEALQKARQHPGRIHALVTDVVMPELSGPELHRRLHRDRPETRVLFISGYTDKTLLEYNVVRHKLPFLPKPFTPDTLLSALQTVLDAPSEEQLSALYRSPGEFAASAGASSSGSPSEKIRGGGVTPQKLDFQALQILFKCGDCVGSPDFFNEKFVVY